MSELPGRDTTKPAEKQGLFAKFIIRRTDGSDAPGGKHDGCDYFVLDATHDPHAKAALAAYAEAVRATHSLLADDMVARYGLASAPQASQSLAPLPDHDNHHNALKCPYCNPNRWVLVPPDATLAPVDPESQVSSKPRLSDRDLIDRFDL